MVSVRLPATCCLLALGGCSDAIDPGFVARRWTSTLGAYNIDAVFPPRHVQVGDVFLVLLPAGSTRTDDLYSRRALRLGRAEVRRSLQADMRTNLVLPPTSGKNPGTDIFGPPDKVVALRPTGYPGFNIANVTEADLGVAFPVQAFRALFGIAGSHELLMSISIPQAEDSELPAYDAYRAFDAFCNPRGGEGRCRLASDGSKSSDAMGLFIHNSCRPNERPGTQFTPWVVFVNHVYYARRIDYAYTTRGGAALDARAALASAAAGKPDSGGATAGSAEAADADARSDAAKLAQALQDRADGAADQAGAAGGRLRVAYAGSQGTLLSQTFETPVAIGYRGLWSRVGPPDSYCDVRDDNSPQGAAGTRQAVR